jgi:hypothetical protein
MAGRLYGGALRPAIELVRAIELPNSMTPDDTAFSRAPPRDVRLAVGEPDGDAGESVTSDRRLLVGSAGGLGDSQKKEPRPGEPEREPDSELAKLFLRLGAGESMSILSDLGDGYTSAMCDGGGVS